MSNENFYEGNFANNVPSGQGRLSIGKNRYYEGEVSFTNKKLRIVGKLVYDGIVRLGKFDGADSETAH